MTLQSLRHQLRNRLKQMHPDISRREHATAETRLLLGYMSLIEKHEKGGAVRQSELTALRQAFEYETGKPK